MKGKTRCIKAAAADRAKAGKQVVGRLLSSTGYRFESAAIHSTWLERIGLMFFKPSVVGNISTAFLTLSVGGNISTALVKKRCVLLQIQIVLIISLIN